MAILKMMLSGWKRYVLNRIIDKQGFFIFKRFLTYFCIPECVQLFHFVISSLKSGRSSYLLDVIVGLLYPVISLQVGEVHIFFLRSSYVVVKFSSSSHDRTFFCAYVSDYQCISLGPGL